MSGLRRRVAALNLGQVLPLAGLSFAIAAVLDVMGSGAPLALHAGGLSLADTGLLQAIYLPTGLGILWAPFVDRRATGSGTQKRLVIVSLLCGTALLAAIGAAASWPPVLLVGLALAASIAVSISDLASQALVIETVSPERRAWLVTSRLIAASAGSSAGIAVATVAPDSLSRACVLVALCAALLGLSMLAYPDVRDTSPRDAEAVGLSRKGLAAKAAVLTFYCVASIMLTASQGLALIDIGVRLPIVGIVSGIATTVATGAAMIVSATISKRVTVPRQIAWSAAGAMLAAALLIVAIEAGLPHAAVLAMLLAVTFDAGINVPYMRLMYRWSEGKRPAASFAVLSSTVFVASFPARLIGPAVAAKLGWPTYYGIGLALYGMAGAGLCVSASTR